MTGSDLRAAVAGGALGAEQAHTQLLTSIVQVARAIFSAKASSIMLHDASTNELVFEAVTGDGENTLIGRRIPADTGVAGWVLASRQPIVIEDTTNDPRFAKDVAESTGLVPKGLMVVPLMLDDRAVGVLSVLDRPQRSTFSLPEVGLLELFAHQAAIAVDLVQRGRHVRELLEAEGDEASELALLATTIEKLPDVRRVAAEGLIAALRGALDV